jgi:hypothetical protein
MGSISLLSTDDRPILGLIASEMNIHRAPGDIGNRRTFDFPVIQTEIKGALLVSMVTDEEHDDEMVDAFVEAGNRLIDQGAIGLVTSCGFWAISQKKYVSRGQGPCRALTGDSESLRDYQCQSQHRLYFRFP